ncbi:hypothetical protein FOZ63_008556, partial [Perkinsus olseni]
MVIEDTTALATTTSVDGDAELANTAATADDGDGHSQAAAAAAGERRNTWSIMSARYTSKNRLHAASETLTEQQQQQQPRAGKCSTCVDPPASSPQPATRAPSSSPTPASPSSTSSSSPSPQKEKSFHRHHTRDYDGDSPMLKMEERKLFLGGLPPNCDKQQLREYFSQFGAIEDSIVMIDRATGRSRGFGFITFLQPQDMEVCLDHMPHVIMDKTIDVKRAVEGGLGPRVTRHRQQGPMKAAWSNNDNIYYYGGSSRGGGSYRGYSGGKWSTSSSYTLPYRVPDDPSKVFIGGLPASADEDSLTDMLGQYGNIVDCNVMFDRGTGRNRGFGYATFSTPAEANAACHGGDSNVMDGKWVEVKPCTRLEFPTSTPPPTTTTTETFKATSGAVYGSYQQQRGAYSTQQAQKQQQQQQPKLPDNPCKVFLGGLPQSADQDRVTEHLSQYGDVLDVTVMYDRDTGRHRGFAYATFSNNEEAQAAINGNSNNVIDGKWVQVKPSSRSMEHVGKAFQVTQQQQQQGSGGGHYRNGGSSSNTSPRTGAYYQSQQQRHHQQQRTSPSPSPYRRPGGRSSDTYTTGYTSGKRRDDKQERTLVGYSRYQSSLRPKDQPDHHGTSDHGDDEDQQQHEQHEAQPQLRQQEPPPRQQQLSPHRQEEEAVVEDRKYSQPEQRVEDAGNEQQQPLQPLQQQQQQQSLGGPQYEQPTPDQAALHQQQQHGLIQQPQPERQQQQLSTPPP